MTRRSKAEILEALPIHRLRALADALELDGSRRSKVDLVESFVRQRRITAESLLQQLNVAGLQELASAVGVQASGKKKDDLVAAILGITPSSQRSSTRDKGMSKQKFQDEEDASDQDASDGGVTSLEEGTILDYITNQPIKDTAKEQVRQRISRALFHEYAISVDDMAPDFKMSIDGRRKKIDLVIFEPGQGHDVEHIRRIVVCEKEPTNGRKDAYKMRSPEEAKEEFRLLQAAMSEAPNCKYGLWTNGLELFFFEKEVTRFDVKFNSIGDWPPADETVGTRDVASTARMRRAEPEMLKTAFRRCHNFIHGNEGMSKDAAFWQFLYLIFCKMYDERQSHDLRRFWAGPTEQFNDEGRREVKKRIIPLFEDVKKKYKTIFRGNEEITLSDRAGLHGLGTCQVRLQPHRCGCQGCGVPGDRGHESSRRSRPVFYAAGGHQVNGGDSRSQAQRAHAGPGLRDGRVPGGHDRTHPGTIQGPDRFRRRRYR